MEPYRLKMRIGDHDFEAEGDPETVKAQLEIFKELVKESLAAPKDGAYPPPPAPPTDAMFSAQQNPPNTTSIGAIDLEAVDGKISSIMKMSDRWVSLTVRAATLQDAAVLIIYGQKVFRNSDAITGDEIARGLKESGFVDPRTDRLLEAMAAKGYIIVTGVHRAKRYRITNHGMRAARQLAADIIKTVA